MGNNKIIKRSEVDSKYTWNLEDIFKTEEEFFHSIDEAYKISETLVSMEGRVLETSKTFLTVLENYENCERIIHLVTAYAMLVRDVDTGNSKSQEIYAKSMSTYIEISEKLSFIIPEIIETSEEIIKSYINEEEELKRYKNFIRDVRRQKEHFLSPEVEKLLAGMQEMANIPYETYAKLSNADLKFPTAKLGEEDVQITNGRFVSFQMNEDREFRKEVFEKYYETFHNFKNTFANLYNSQVRQLIFQAKTRKYSSTIEASLDENNVSKEIYENLLEAVNENLDKMHKYISMRKRCLGLDEQHIYDVYIPLISGVDNKYTIEEAKELVLSALSPLGEDYIEIVRKAFDNRWIDFVENEGKRSGAYSMGVYGVHPYILLNFDGTIGSVFTLAHEIGHTMHSYFSNKTQSYIDSKYKIFVAEVASTTNEVLLMEYLLKEAKTDKERLYLVNRYMEKFKSTVYRQTMFAEFEKVTNELAEQGEALTDDRLTEIYFELNKKYYGSDVVVDKEIGYEWMRIPHFYYNFYVYQYATGFSAAVAIAYRILRDEKNALEDYKEFLSSGCTKDPVSLLKIAGVDMAKKEPIEDALKIFEKTIEEMERLLDNKTRAS